MIDNPELLKDVCDSIISRRDLQPEKNSAGKIIRTHCNEGAIIVAQALGCNELDGLMADDQYQVMMGNSSGNWRHVEGQEAVLHALDGKLAFAALPSFRLDEEHGHIAAIYPVSMQKSNSFNKDVPMVANVGASNAEEKVSQAFPVKMGEPEYFTWEG